MLPQTPLTSLPVSLTSSPDSPDITIPLGRCGGRRLVGTAPLPGMICPPVMEHTGTCGGGTAAPHGQSRVPSGRSLEGSPPPGTAGGSLPNADLPGHGSWASVPGTATMQGPWFLQKQLGPAVLGKGTGQPVRLQDTLQRLQSPIRAPWDKEPPPVGVGTYGSPHRDPAASPREERAVEPGQEREPRDGVAVRSHGKGRGLGGLE